MSADAVDNARLPAALAAYHAGPTPERRQWITVQLCAASFLVPLRSDGLAAGAILAKAALAPGARLALALTADEQGRPLLPVFTSPTAAGALVRQGCALLRSPAHELWAMAAEISVLAGVVVDPDGAGWALDPPAIRWLHEHGRIAAVLATRQGPG